MSLQNNLYTETGWEIVERTFNADQIVTTGSNFMIGNGYLGYRGTFEEWEAKEYVACTVTDTWDQAEGSRWSELCNVPNGLFTQLFIEGEQLSVHSGNFDAYYRALDMRYGLNQRKLSWRSDGGKTIQIDIEKFASHKDHHLLVLNYKVKALQTTTFTVVTGIDGEVWSLNGEHFKSYRTKEKNDLICLELETSELGTEITVVEGLTIHGGSATTSEIISKDKSILRKYTFNAEANQEITLQKVVAITHSNEVENPLETAVNEVQEALLKGYKNLKEEHQKCWEEFWNISDIKIQGNTEAQVLARFNIYQAYIATPRHSNLPIGARGLSCQVYQGAAFWDQETFNLPMYAYTHPEIAKKLVTYRHDTLEGAKRKAKRLGYYGAFYAWTSGKTGDELFPDFFFTDVLTGRKIRNHFNCWQIHISPDVVYGIWTYYEASNDWEFMLNYGAEVIFEVAQFLVSRVHFKKDKNRYELIRVLGPDEYHENVDNNAYTNYLSKYALEKAVHIFSILEKQYSQELTALLDRTGISKNYVAEWKEIIELLYVPEPNADTKVIEQFDQYFQLEDIRPDALRKRLIDPSEYWGWPNGIAVNTQVLKQADVIQLLALTDHFPQDVLTANYEYYEPRTEHGSSLSPSVHALVACKANHHAEAYRYFMESATIDLYNASKKVLSGGSFLGGIHTAAAGGVWRIIIEGFSGFSLKDDAVHFDPKLPETWNELSFNLNIKECLISVSIKKGLVSLRSSPSNTKSLKIIFRERQFTLAPGRSLEI